MSNYANTKATIDANVYENHLNQVTGPMANAAIKSVVDALIGGGFLYKGVAHPADAAVTPDANCFWIATDAGTYTNKNGYVLDGTEAVIIKYNGSWSKENTGIKLVSVSQNTQTMYKTEVNVGGVDYPINNSVFENIFPLTGNVTGKYIDANGVEQSLAGFSHTQEIELDAEIDYIVTSFGDATFGLRFALYDSSHNFIKTITNNGEMLVTYYLNSSIAKYVIINYQNAHIYRQLLQKSLDIIKPNTPDLLQGLSVVGGSFHHYIGANGEIQEYDNAHILGYYGFVRVNPSTDYLVKKQFTFNAILAFYDWNGGFISLLDGTSYSQGQDIEFTTPSNCYWVRVNKFADSSPYLRYKQESTIVTRWMGNVPSANALVGAPDQAVQPTPVAGLNFNTRSVNTFIGAMNYVLTKLFTQRPLARVVFITHYSRDYTSKGSVSNLVKAQLGLAEYWQAPVINLCDNLNWVRRDGLDLLGAHISDHLHPAQDYDTNTQKSANIEEIAKICADELLKIYPADEWSGKKVAWFGTSIPDGYPYTPQGEGRTTWEVNARYPNVAVGQLLGATIYNYAKGGALVRQKKYDGSSFPAGDSYRDQFSNDDVTYNANNTGVYEHDYEYGRITYKTYIIDKLGTEYEPDLYVFDFGFNDFYIDSSDFADLNYNSIP